MFHVILYEPEIPPNTGNVIRLCANMGATLHLVKPLGFVLDDKRLRRAGLDYREWARVREHDRLSSCLAEIDPPALYALTTKGSRCYTEPAFSAGDAFLFGPESRGLPSSVLESIAASHRLFVPMVPGSRSLNLSNTVAVMLYEAWRQRGYAGSDRF